MRPDPHKQKASRRHQAKHGGPRSTRNERRAAAVPEQPQFENLDDIQQNDDAVDSSQKETQEFLEYLKEESVVNHQQSSNDAFFKLREEIVSEELDKYADDIWKQLLDVDMDLLATSLAHSSQETPLNKLLGFDDDLAMEFPIPPPSKAKFRQDTATTIPQQKHTAKPLTILALTAAMSSSSLAPGLKKAKPSNQSRAPKMHDPPRQPAKPQKPADDDLEAFLDDII
ncbi:hypothetical protein EV175_000695 [Coemansia sp. RSA 1933]|nr:hypothetical protein EV175_000695 [Coemansia sp. RSA 1933]